MTSWGSGFRASPAAVGISMTTTMMMMMMMVKMLLLMMMMLPLMLAISVKFTCHHYVYSLYCCQHYVCPM